MGAAAASARSQVTAALTAPGQPFEVGEEVVAGRRMRVFTQVPPTLWHVLAGTAAFGDEEYLVYAGSGELDERTTYAEHQRLAAGLARRWLEVDRLRPGDRVAVATRNLPEWVVAFWAAQAAGLVAVPVNAWWAGGELEYGLRDSGARWLLCDGERWDRVADLVGGLPALETVVVTRPQKRPLGSALSWPDVLAQLDPQATLPEAVRGPDDPATILYTSGTTGRPKGAVGTHRAHVTNIWNTLLSGAVSAGLAERAAAAAGTTVPAPLPPVSLVVFPMFHVGGLTGMQASTALAARVVLIHHWDTRLALDLVERERVTGTGMVPTLLRQLLDAPDLAARDLSSLGSVAAGGAPVPSDLTLRVGGQFAGAVSPANGYGLTETMSAVVTNVGAEFLARPDSVGRPTPTTDLRVVGPDGTDVPAGEVGELWVFGPNVMAGYWGRREATEEAVTDGWFHTGDLARIDADGLTFVVDRLKDVVIRGGENVYCAEVEDVLFRHPAVADVAVVGLPHLALGEEVAAVVQPREGMTVSADELRRHVAGALAAFKVPSVIVLRPTPLPRSGVGKVLKRSLRDELSGGG